MRTVKAHKEIVEGGRQGQKTIPEPKKREKGKRSVQPNALGGS
jgi:hypothetical protein